MNKTRQVEEMPPNGDYTGELYSRVLKKIQKMSNDELFASMVATGIYTESGKLTKEYGGRARAKK
jgi:hypothetical protein